ncbi:MAG: zinc-binding dehydrogenase [Nocardiopsaceae bacterium]|nr:zinc-binding dehydrogenase [Nocardiopsaceae bacterium]
MKAAMITHDGAPDALPRRAAAAEHTYVQHDPEGLRSLTDLVGTGQLVLRVADRYPLHQIQRAHERFEAGGLLGKIVLNH